MSEKEREEDSGRMVMLRPETTPGLAAPLVIYEVPAEVNPESVKNMVVRLCACGWEPGLVIVSYFVVKGLVEDYGEGFE